MRRFKTVDGQTVYEDAHGPHVIRARRERDRNTWAAIVGQVHPETAIFTAHVDANLWDSIGTVAYDEPTRAEAFKAAHDWLTTRGETR